MSLWEKYAYSNVRFRMIHPQTGEGHWLTFRECARALDQGWPDGEWAMDLDKLIERECTEEEKRDITNASHDYSGSK